MVNYLKQFLSAVALLMLVQLSHAQNQSTQTFFGKNRVQYKTVDWSYYRSARFDVFFYEEGRELATNTAKMAGPVIKEVEDFLNYRVEGRYQIIVYRKLEDLQQTNLGLDLEQYNTGGLTRLGGNKVMVYFDGDQDKFKRNLRAGISKALIYDMLYGGNIREKVQSSSLIFLPDWYLNGFLSFMADEWNTQSDAQLRNLFLKDKYHKFNQFLGQDQVLIGKSFWYFLSETYGKPALSNIIYLTRVNKDYETALIFVLGKGTKTLTKEWFLFYNNRYHQDSEFSNLPANEFTLKKFKNRTTITQIKYAPNDNYLAYVTHRDGKNNIVIFDQTKETHEVYHKSGLKYTQLQNYNQYPVLAWHPSGRSLAYVYQSKGLTYFGVLKPGVKDKKQVKTEIPILRFDDVLSMNYSPDGQNIVMSASRGGKSDIYSYNVISKRITQITQDRYDDFDPIYLDKAGKYLVFSSRRPNDFLSNDSLRPLDFTDLYLFNNVTSKIARLTNTPLTQELLTQPINSKYFAYLSDENGVFNRYHAQLDSTLDRIDTLMLSNTLGKDSVVLISVFKDTAFTTAATNYKTGIQWYNINIAKNYIVEQFSFNDKAKIYLYHFNEDSLWKTDIPTPKTTFRYSKELGYLEQMTQDYDGKTTQANEKSDSSLNINHYKFQVETDITTVSGIDDSKGIDKKDPISNDPNAQFRVSNTKIYQTSFSTDYIVSQFGNSLVQNNLPTFIISSLNSLSQRTGLIFMAGTSDLFEDHKFSGGIRLSTDLRNNEYYLMYENLKTRIDKKYIFHQHRQRFLATPFDRIQYNSTELITSFKYPFNPQSSLQFNCLYRRDVLDTLSTDLYSLQSKTTITNWAGSRVEYIFDNTRMDQVLNILYGTRYKIFIEGYKEFGTPKQYMGLVGLDFRNYTKIHRNFIWANRLAFNASFGPQHILYYLGGVDGWLFSKYDNSLPVPPNQNFAFEALGTNMRGFFQNARNGSNYAVINSELRFPIFSYLSKAPISSDFFRNFQFIAFTDVGTAWSGTSPFNTDNPFNVQTFNRGPITVTLFTNKNPILVGYGTGVRTRLFGYFVRTDIAWGIDDGQISNPIYYLSLSLDF